MASTRVLRYARRAAGGAVAATVGVVGIAAWDHARLKPMYQARPPAAQSTHGDPRQPPEDSAAKKQRRKILVLGGGIVGVVTAYRLASRGCEVTVLERHDAPAKGVSRVNAGAMRISKVEPIITLKTAPDIVRGLLPIAFGGSDIYRVPLSVWFDPDLWRWGLRVVFQCLHPKYHEEQLRFMAGCNTFFTQSTRKLAKEAGVRPQEYSAQTPGTLFVYLGEPGNSNSEGAQAFEAVKKRAQTLKSLGMAMEALDAEAAVKIEPTLAPHLASGHLCGAALTGGDEIGECEMFARALARQATAKYGVQFLYGKVVNDLVLDEDARRLRGVRCADGELLQHFDDVVCCLGLGSKQLLETAGVSLPVYNARGYSLTLESSAGAPRTSNALISWMPMKLACTRYDKDGGGFRLRVSSICEFATCREDEYQVTSALAEVLYQKAAACFPEIPMNIWRESAELRVGGRPWVPDDVPVVSGTRLENLFINSGHGHMGWRMAAGTAEHLAWLMVPSHEERQGGVASAPLDPEWVSLARFGRYAVPESRSALSGERGT